VTGTSAVVAEASSPAQAATESINRTTAAGFRPETGEIRDIGDFLWLVSADGAHAGERMAAAAMSGVTPEGT
jgi:hypothetical protein